MGAETLFDVPSWHLFLVASWLLLVRHLLLLAWHLFLVAMHLFLVAEMCGLVFLQMTCTESPRFVKIQMPQWVYRALTYVTWGILKGSDSLS